MMEITNSSQSLISKKYMDGLANIIKDIKKNYKSLNAEWVDFKKDVHKQENSVLSDVNGDYILIHKNDLCQLGTEITQLKQTLPKIINRKYISSVGRVESLEEELQSLKTCKELLEYEINQCKTRCEMAVTECQIEKQETLQLRCDIENLSQQLSGQSDYCSSLGAACCILLWRVSRKQEGVEAILGGSKVDFFAIVSSMLDGFLTAYKEEWPSESSDETNIIFALCGTTSNITASAYGRNFIITNQHGRQLIDTFSVFIREAPVKKSAAMKDLILMCLYNISINQKGLKYLCSKPDIMSLFTWHLQAETDSENRLNTLRIIQSLISDKDNISTTHQLQEQLPMSYLQKLRADRDENIQDISLEIIMDLQNSCNILQSL